MNNIIDFEAIRQRKLKSKNYTGLLTKMVEYFRLLHPKTDERAVLAFAVASVENKRNLGHIDEFNNLKPIA